MPRLSRFACRRLQGPALLFAFFLLCCSLSSGAQTAITLNTGDIAFTGYNSITGTSTTYNQFSFIVLRDGGLPPGTQIAFTDNGYNTAGGANAFSTNEGTITWSWTGGSNLPQLTEVTIKTSTSGGTAMDGCSYGSATVTGPFNLSLSGDQILSYQGSLTGTYRMLTGIQTNAENAGGANGISTLADWDNSYTTYTASRCSRPGGLTNGVNAVMLVNNTNVGGPWSNVDEFDNWKFNCTGAAASSVADLRAAINNRVNWVGQDQVVQTLPTGCSYSVVPPVSIGAQPSNSSTCAGGNVAFSVTASNASSYQWYVSTNGGASFSALADAGPYSGTITSLLTIAGATVAMNNTLYRVRVTGAGSSTTSNSALLTVAAPGTWLGGSSTAWSNTANWSCGTLPTATSDVTIPAGTAYSPLVDIGTAVVNNLTIASGAMLAFTGSGNALDIKGAVTNSGTFDAAGGKAVFSGSSQTIPAGTYQNLQMNGAGSKTLAGAVTVSGALTLTNGFILLGSSNLTIGAAGSISGGSASSFLVVSGTGGLVQQNIGAGGRTGTVLFPVGTSASSYTPASLSNAGTADNFTLRVINNVYSTYDAADNPTSTAQTSNAVARTWTLSEGTPGGSNASLTLRWNGPDELAGFNRGSSFVSHYTGGSWQASPAAAASGPDPYEQTLAGVTSFSPFGVSSAGAPLPLTLLTFTAQRQTGGAVRLEWTTANESGLSAFELERSADGKLFRQQGPRVVAGNHSANAYALTDDSCAAGARVFYRLKVLDQHGSASYSAVAGLAGEAAAPALRIAPNPLTGDQLRLFAPAGGPLRMSLYDLTGNLRRSFTGTVSGTGSAEVNVGDLPAGVYLLHLQAGQHSQYFRLFRK